MKNYCVHFSFYSEENGDFGSAYYRVEAENQFEARRMAWLLRDNDEDTRFQSCVKQSGVSWDASPLDICDYLNAQAAYYKYRIREIANVDIPNAELCKDSSKKEEARRERGYYMGCIDAVRLIASDIGKPLGMAPPDIYEEIEYAWRLVGKLDTTGRYEQAAALAERIDREKSWDDSVTRGLTELFENGYIELKDEIVNLAEYFGRDGVYPERGNLNDNYYPSYVMRRERAWHVEALDRLPMFGEKNVIDGSAEAMPYDYKTLVLRQETLKPEYRKPENMLWTPHYDFDGTCINLGSGEQSHFNVENMITGVVVALRRVDFVGVLRPEYADNINFDALKQEYAALHTEQVPVYALDNSAGVEDDDEWEQGD
jgi:hypothetical protein